MNREDVSFAGVLAVLIGLCIWIGYLVYPKVHAAESIAVDQTLLDAASTDETRRNVGQGVSRARECAVYVEWSVGVSVGVVEVESASSTNYGGTWGSQATVTFAGTPPKADVVQITGIHGALQTRISTAVSGGTVTTKVKCN